MTDATAVTAMRHWTAGAATGDWSRLVAMLDPAVAFQVPVAGFPGPRTGVADATRFFAHLTAVLRADLAVTGTYRDDAGRTVFEVAVRGTMHGRAFGQALCLVFDVDGGRVRAFREYLAWPGGLDPGPAADHGPSIGSGPGDRGS